MRILLLVLAIGFLVVEASEHNGSNKPSDPEEKEEQEEQAVSVEKETIENADTACSQDPTFSKDCAKPMNLFYFDQESKSCKSRKMCPPAEFGNSFATEENCNALCVDDPDEDPKVKAERILGLRVGANVLGLRLGVGAHIGVGHHGYGYGHRRYEYGGYGYHGYGSPEVNRIYY